MSRVCMHAVDRRAARQQLRFLSSQIVACYRNLFLCYNNYLDGRGPGSQVMGGADVGKAL